MSRKDRVLPRMLSIVPLCHTTIFTFTQVECYSFSSYTTHLLASPSLSSFMPSRRKSYRTLYLSICYY
ncbi:hypothetical protein JHK86_003929 [Glycine max]|nr:hypothetical protein JHK86_003929 [Glycine max]